MAVMSLYPQIMLQCDLTDNNKHCLCSCVLCPRVCAKHAMLRVGLARALALAIA